MRIAIAPTAGAELVHDLAAVDDNRKHAHNLYTAAQVIDLADVIYLTTPQTYGGRTNV